MKHVPEVFICTIKIQMSLVVSWMTKSFPWNLSVGSRFTRLQWVFGRSSQVSIGRRFFLKPHPLKWIWVCDAWVMLIGTATPLKQKLCSQTFVDWQSDHISIDCVVLNNDLFYHLGCCCIFQVVIDMCAWGRMPCRYGHDVIFQWSRLYLVISLAC